MLEVRRVAALILNLQLERAAVARRLYMRSTEDNVDRDLNLVYEKTDQTLTNIEWQAFGSEKIFTSKLRFQIKLDDFR